MFRECEGDLDLDGRVFLPMLLRCGEGGRIIGRGYGDLLSNPWSGDPSFLCFVGSDP